MSYGISAVIMQPEKGSEDKVPFIFIGGFDGMNWSLADDPRKIQRLNNSCKKFLKEEPNGISSLELLKTAPMDSVVVITGESSYEFMSDRNPLNCSKGSGNEKIWADVQGYLEGKY